MNKESNREWWQNIIIAIAALISIGWIISSVASCQAKVQSVYYEKKHENNKVIIEHEKWLLENGHTMGDSIIHR